MFSQIVLVGKVAKDLEFMKNDEDKKAKLVLAIIQEPFKNEKGGNTDLIPILINQFMAESIESILNEGDVVACKSHLKPRIITTKENENINVVEVIGDKITILNHINK